jgi:hypothetical protein
MVSVLTFIFEHFEILITGMTRTSYSKLMEIDNITLTKMKYVLNKDGACISRDQIGFMLRKYMIRKKNDELVVMTKLKPRLNHHCLLHYLKRLLQVLGHLG